MVSTLSSRLYLYFSIPSLVFHVSLRERHSTVKESPFFNIWIFKMRGKYDDGRRRGNEEWGAIKITFPQCYNLALVQRKEAENTVVLLLKIEQAQN